MMLIGTSLGGCLKSIVSGEVSSDDVLVIITRTDCPDFESYIKVVKRYIDNGNIYANVPDRYNFTGIDSDDVIDLATNLWIKGKIHQPRLFGSANQISTEVLWMNIVPPNTNKHPAVIEAYEKYKMLDNLTK